MTLLLDERRRSMLAEMGVDTFWLPDAPVIDEPTHWIAGQAGNDSGAETAVMPGLTRHPAAAPIPHATSAKIPNNAVDQLEWDALAEAAASCRACGLCDGRRNAVFGVGDPHPDWLVIGEPPDEEEDLQAEPFVGDAGKLLDNMLRAVGASRSSKAYLMNVLKCRPTGRNPEPAELAECSHFLRRQVELLQPKVILVMGRFSIQALLGATEPLGKLRGRAHRYMDIPVVATYHPAALLRTPADKAKAWADLCLAQALMRESQPG